MGTRAFVIAALLAALLGTGVPPQARAGGPQAAEYQVKAACLYNFARYVEWPPGAFADRRSPIVFGLLGDDPFGRALELLRGKSVQGRPVVVRRWVGAEEAAGCHVLFIAPSEEGRLETLLERLGKAPVLTVGDLERFAARGGMIQLLTAGGRVRFAVNPEALRRGGLRASSRLLELAELVPPSPGEGRR